MSQMLSLRLSEELAERLDRFARSLGNGMTRSRVSMLLLEEAMRAADFALLEFRDSTAGRQAYMKDSSLAVWEVILIARNYDMDAERVADYFQRPVEWVKAAFNYYEAYKAEIDQAIEDNHFGEERLRRLFPDLVVYKIPQEVLKGE